MAGTVVGGGLTIRTSRVRVVDVPLNFPLGTSAATVTKVPLVLLDLDMEEGVTGRAYVFGYTPAGAVSIARTTSEAADLAKGTAASPLQLQQCLGRRYALLGVTGTVRMALSLLDMAVWDALGRAAGLPVARLLGGAPGTLAAYDSRGLGLAPPAELGRQAERLLELELGAIKLRLGYPTLAEDLVAVDVVRSLTDRPLMVDYNQALSLVEARARGRALEEKGLLWLEEPIRHDDYSGAAALADELDLPIQIGENFNGCEAMLQAVQANACDLAMPDISRIGGVTGWLQAAGVAAAAGIPVSTHLMPEMSAHALAASATSHWLEYVDWADAILREPLQIRDGRAILPDNPGFGIEWDEKRISALSQ
ncbi:MAG: mandelate racemase [Mesorhizobium sp.]|nr:mandelate racemase [Mesorhizobium sp.]